MRWEEGRQTMNAALQRHDALMRRAIEAHGGYVFKTVGDEFCSAFPTPQSALAAALDAQRALAANDFTSVAGIRVRMALHAGLAEERDGDYFGPPVNRVARLLSIGHGAQVLLSSAVAALLQGELPKQISLRDLGVHRLKDLAPERIHQLVAPDLPDAFPALRSLDALPNNLPPQLTSFIGRETEVSEIKALLQNRRLVTLVGAGGAGKTRCATQIGAELLDGFSEGVWFVQLAPISESSLIASAIAQALNVQSLPNKPVFDMLLHYLKRKRMLLIIDNCEHLIDGVRNVVTSILQNCDNVWILATSRERLNISGETIFRMPSLPVPPADPKLSPDATLQYGAAALFAARACAADSRFAITAKNAPVVAEICRRIDGIPLAIELAATRIKMLSPLQLAQKLDDRFRLLTGVDRTALPRHQTMRALIDWSYDLLTDQERALFRKISIFAGGFTLTTAHTVCADDVLDEIGLLDVLSSLVDKSLVQVDPGSDVARYRLLESTRQYAIEKLRETGEYAAVARAHAQGFLALAESLEDINVVPDREWFSKAAPELDNWRAALEWTFGTREEALLGQRLAAATRRTWSNMAVSDGLRWLRAALDSIDGTTPAPVIANLDQTEAQLKGVLGLHQQSLEAAQRAIARYTALDDLLSVAKAKRQAGRSLVFLGQIAQGEALLHEALETFRHVGDRALIGATLDNLAIARGAVEDIAGARTFFAEALAIFKAIGADRLAAAVENNLAESEFHGGDALSALRLADDALAFYGADIVSHRRALLLSNVAAYLGALARHDEARARAREALVLSRSLDYTAVIIWAIQHLAAVAVLRQDVTTERARIHLIRAARLVGYVDAQVATLQMKREFTEQQEYEAALAALRGLGENELVKLMLEGRTWTEDQAVIEAMLV